MPCVSRAVDMQTQIQMLDNEIAELYKSNAADQENLNKCASNLKTFKIAGITTLSLTAVAAIVNIVEAVQQRKLNQQIKGYQTERNESVYNARIRIFNDSLAQHREFVATITDPRCAPSFADYINYINGLSPVDVGTPDIDYDNLFITVSLSGMKKSYQDCLDQLAGREITDSQVGGIELSDEDAAKQAAEQAKKAAQEEARAQEDQTVEENQTTETETEQQTVPETGPDGKPIEKLPVPNPGLVDIENPTSPETPNLPRQEGTKPVRQKEEPSQSEKKKEEKKPVKPEKKKPAVPVKKQEPKTPAAPSRQADFDMEVVAAVIRRKEGKCTNIYLDSNRQITTGFGHQIGDFTEFARMEWVGPDNYTLTDAQELEFFRAITGYLASSKMPYKPPRDCFTNAVTGGNLTISGALAGSKPIPVSKIRATERSIENALTGKLESLQTYLMRDFDCYKYFPPGPKYAMTDMKYAMGVGGFSAAKWPTLYKCVKAWDWECAASKSHSNSSNSERNDQRAAWFRSGIGAPNTCPH